MGLIYHLEPKLNDYNTNKVKISFKLKQKAKI